MSKEGAIDTALAQLMLMLAPEEKAHTVRLLETLYEEGHTQGMLDTDSKLDEALRGIKRANDNLELTLIKLKQACSDRDVFLMAFTQVAHERAIQGLLGAGFHPPNLHQSPKYQPRLGKVKCSRCSDKIKMWNALTEPEKKAAMEETYASVLQKRAVKLLQNGAPATGPSPTAPTTHELGGQKKPDPEVGDGGKA